LFILTRYIELAINTRFGAKPTPPDTFLNFQPPANSAAYFPERARITASTGNRLLDTNVEFQKEDRVKKLNLQ
jgi:hypothetical protein